MRECCLRREEALAWERSAKEKIEKLTEKNRELEGSIESLQNVIAQLTKELENAKKGL